MSVERFKRAPDGLSAPVAIREVVAACDRFRSLQQHARVLSRRFGRSHERELHVLLERLVRDGFLVSESALRRRIADAPAGPGRAQHARIEIIGIPTADRPNLLRRALRTYAASVEACGRRATFLVVDDSRTAAAVRANGAVVTALHSDDMPMIHVGPRERRVLVSDIARATRDPDLARFALLPREEGMTTTGAARNTLLLLSAGRLSVQVDDDTLPDVAPAGASAERLLSIGRMAVPTGVHFDTWTNLRRRARRAGDWLGLHERLLGRTVQDCLADPSFAKTRLDAVDAQFTARLHTREAVVRTTTFGTLGETGGSVRFLFFFVPDLCRKLLAAGGPISRTVFRDRRILRVAPAYTIADTPFHAGINRGLDGDAALPPFLPLGRNADSVFGAVLRQRGSLTGLLPHAILHLPPPDTRRGLRPRPSLLSVSEHLLRLTAFAEMERAPDVGDFLARVGRWSDSRFERLVARLASDMAGQQTRFLAQLADGAQDVPAYREHVLSLIRQLGAASARPVPVTDLRGGDWTRINRLRWIVSQYGRLLGAWPSIVAAGVKRARSLTNVQ